MNNIKTGYIPIFPQEYADAVATTVIWHYRDDFGYVEWRDKDGKIIASRICDLDPRDCPRLGEVIEY